MLIGEGGVWIDDGRLVLAPPHGSEVFLGLADGMPLFAVDTGAAEPARGHAAGLRAAATELSQPEAALAAYAASLLDWHRRHRFCANCGAPTAVADGGHERRCPACEAHHFPRTDPVVIVRVLDGRGRLLLGNQSRWERGALLPAGRLRRAGGDARGRRAARGGGGVWRRGGCRLLRGVAALAVPELADARLPGAGRARRAARGRRRADGRALVRARRGGRGRRGSRRAQAAAALLDRAPAHRRVASVREFGDPGARDRRRRSSRARRRGPRRPPRSPRRRPRAGRGRSPRRPPRGPPRAPARSP